MNYDTRVNTYVDRGQMWQWGYNALARLTAQVVDQHIERSVYLRQRGRLDAALARREQELMDQMYRDHLGNPTQAGH